MGQVTRYRIWLSVFMAGLIISGLTAFPLESELKFVAAMMAHSDSQMARWFQTVYEAVRTTNQQYPYLAYGTDWLAFGHLVIAGVFVGPWLHPVRNRWVIDFGLIACCGVIPLALIAGLMRSIPAPWRLVDMSFGAFGVIPLLICRRLSTQLQRPPTCPVADQLWLELVASFRL